MTQAEAYAFLEPTLRDVLNRPTLVVTPELSAGDVPGWDSFKQVSIFLAIEDQYGFEFAAEDLESVKTVGDFVRLMLAKIG